MSSYIMMYLDKLHMDTVCLDGSGTNKLAAKVGLETKGSFDVQDIQLRLRFQRVCRDQGP